MYQIFWFPAHHKIQFVKPLDGSVNCKHDISLKSRGSSETAAAVWSYSKRRGLNKIETLRTQHCVRDNGKDHRI
jgi:hypothetical protein